METTMSIEIEKKMITLHGDMPFHAIHHTREPDA